VQVAVTQLACIALPFALYVALDAVGVDVTHVVFLLAVAALFLTALALWAECLAIPRRRDPPEAPEATCPPATAIIAAYLPNEAETVLDTVGAFLEQDYPSLRLARARARRALHKLQKGRAVPLVPDVATQLARLSQREHFTGPDDLVFPGAAGDHLEASALRRRFAAARRAAALRDGPPSRRLPERRGDVSYSTEQEKICKRKLSITAVVIASGRQGLLQAATTSSGAGNVDVRSESSTSRVPRRSESTTHHRDAPHRLRKAEPPRDADVGYRCQAEGRPERTGLGEQSSTEHRVECAPRASGQESERRDGQGERR